MVHGGATTCAACGVELPDGAKFCHGCGTPTGPQACSSCGAPLAPDARFCSQCGASLAGPSPRAQPDPIDAGPTKERRILSVLFADLVGFTPLSEERDHEEVRELLTEYFDNACNCSLTLSNWQAK